MEQPTRAEVIAKYQKHEKDTGSSALQVALLTKRIKELTEHFKIHTKDYAGLRGMKALVESRKTLLQYIKKHNEAEYKALISELGIRK